MERNLIVGMGEILWDILPEGKQLGGAPVNFTYHVSQLGLNALAVSAVGHDALGDEILSVLCSRNMEHRIFKVDFPTGTVNVTLDTAGVPSYEICEGVAWDNIPADKSLIGIAHDTAAFCFGTLAQRNEISRRAIRSFLELMPQNDDVLKIYDINLRQHFYSYEIIKESMRLCNILKINDDEYIVLSEMFGLPINDLVAGARRLISEFNLKTVIVTCGATGSYAVTVDDASWLPTPKVEVRDTVGAGDSFTATFIGAWLSGMGLREAHCLAVDVAAYVCSCSGAMPQLPESLKQRLG